MVMNIHNFFPKTMNLVQFKDSTVMVMNPTEIQLKRFREEELEERKELLKKEETDK